MDTSHIIDVIEKLTRCWDARDIDGVLGFYSDDIDYREPGAGVTVTGRVAMHSYLSQYFQAWDSRWHIKDCVRLEGRDGAIAVWDLEVWRPGTDTRLTTHGMDILMVRGNQVCSDVVFFDRTQLRPLLERKPT